MKRILAIAALLALVLGASMVATRRVSARTHGNGTLLGLVLGPDDRPVPYASVTYQSASGSEPHALRADSHGRFRITRLNEDAYSLRATRKGIFSEWEKNVMVHKGETKSVTLRLIYAREMPKWPSGRSSSSRH
jgi:hypothetical protein